MSNNISVEEFPFLCLSQSVVNLAAVIISAMEIFSRQIRIKLIINHDGGGGFTSKRHKRERLCGTHTSCEEFSDDGSFGCRNVTRRARNYATPLGPCENVTTQRRLVHTIMITS